MLPQKYLSRLILMEHYMTTMIILILNGFNRDYQELFNNGILLIAATGNSYDAVQSIFPRMPSRLHLLPKTVAG